MFLLYLALLLALCDASPHRVYNYTWQIINEAGNVTNSTSRIAADIPWDPLEVDLCALALGAHDEWGTPLHYLPQTRPIDTGERDTSSRPGCSSGTRRSYLTMAPLYVCPGMHRDRSLSEKCGHATDYFCASWGCETTGDTYWSPSSSWDYITVKRKDPSPHQLNSGPVPYAKQCRNQWCNFLLISFTEKGKQANWLSTRGYEWGLRLYISGKDIGLTFKIKLIKDLPNQQKVAIGPNPNLHGPQAPAPAKRPPSIKATHPSPVTTPF